MTFSRAVWLGLALAACAVLLTARLLEPASAGHGTHLQLGLPPCGFLLATGLPCPGCGLTTAFAALAHGQLTRALAANPLGLPMFLGALALPPYALVQAVRGTSPVQVVDRLALDRVALVLVLALLGAWLTRCLEISLR